MVAKHRRNRQQQKKQQSDRKHRLETAHIIDEILGADQVCLIGRSVQCMMIGLTQTNCWASR